MCRKVHVSVCVGLCCISKIRLLIENIIKRQGVACNALTCSHEFVDFRWTALWLLHAVALLQQVINLRQVNTRVWRHTIGRNLPQKNSKC